MMRRAWIVVMCVGLAGAARSSDAQPRRQVADRRDDAREDRREQIKKKIRAMRAYTLTEELALDETTAARLFPLLARYDDETDKLVEKRVDVQRRLRRADTLRDNRAVDHLLDEALSNQRAFWDLETRRIAELRKLLAPAQVAKVLVVLPALERRIQNQLRRAIVRQNARDGGFNGGPNARPPAVDKVYGDEGDDDTDLDEPAPRPGPSAKPKPGRP